MCLSGSYTMDLSSAMSPQKLVKDQATSSISPKDRVGVGSTWPRCSTKAKMGGAGSGSIPMFLHPYTLVWLAAKMATRGLFVYSTAIPLAALSASCLSKHVTANCFSNIYHILYTPGLTHKKNPKWQLDAFHSLSPERGSSGLANSNLSRQQLPQR